MSDCCGQNIDDGWPCILSVGHDEPWHLTLFGWTWTAEDPFPREGFPPHFADQVGLGTPVACCEGRPAGHTGACWPLGATHPPAPVKAAESDAA